MAQKGSHFSVAESSNEADATTLTSPGAAGATGAASAAVGATEVARETAVAETGRRVSCRPAFGRNGHASLVSNRAGQKLHALHLHSCHRTRNAQGTHKERWFTVRAGMQHRAT